ncbi:phosphodiester glycosidase family protein [bacterium]|nr:phosphodiester glycosidase family protein [bacterium]
MENRKKRGVLITWISLFILFTSLVFFIIGCNSDYLVKDIFRRLALAITILAFLSLIYGVFLIKKYWYRKLFKKLKMWLFSILVALYMIGCSSFLFILYGPYDGFRNWLITTAMGTMNHQYYCKWFYSNDFINEVLGSNYIDDNGAETDANLVDHKESTKYANSYEKEILERKKGILYKVIEFKVNGCNAYLGVVYDASKISVGYSKWLHKSGQYIYDMAKEQNSVLTINGGGFKDPGQSSKGADPIGVTISNGKVITNERTGGAYGVIGFNKNNTLVLRQSTDAYKLINEGVRDAVTMAPFLIVNGKPSFIKGNGGWGIAARTAIGQRKDGIVLFLVVDSNYNRTKGATMADLVDIMQKYGAVNAANLDGGTSSVMVVEGEMINDPIDSANRHRTRGIPTIFKVVE